MNYLNCTNIITVLYIGNPEFWKMRDYLPWGQEDIANTIKCRQKGKWEPGRKGSGSLAEREVGDSLCL
jgi:hypothetical protein